MREHETHRSLADLAALGFGHVELGTVTAEPQGPNPPPQTHKFSLLSEPPHRTFAGGRAPTVRFLPPADVLGIYVFLPEAGAR